MMRTSMGLTTLAGIAIVSVALAGCSAPSGGDASTDGTAIIAAALAMSGPAASVGADIKQGAQLAIDEINETGGLGGRQLELIVEDTAGDPAQAVQLVTSFSKDERVIAVLGPVTAAEVGAVTNIGESAGIVIYPPASAGSVPGIENGKFNDWTFRLNEAIPLVVGPQMAKVLEITNAKHVTILNYDDNAAYVDTGDRWQEAAEEEGVDVSRIQFPTATQDFSSIVTSIPGDTDLIALGALSATDAQLVRAIRQAGIESQIMGDSSMLATEVFEGSRGASEGAYAYSTFLPGQTDASDSFQEAFQSAYDKVPTAISAYAYEAVKLMAFAVGDGDLTRDSIREGLSTLDRYDGITGIVSYDGSGDARRESVPLVQIGADGSLEYADDIVPLKSQ